MKQIYILSLVIFLFSACKKSSDGTKTDPIVTAKTFSVDASFNVQDNTLLYAAVQTDGKIIAASGTQIKRLNKDGSQDNSFAVGNVAGGAIHAIALQSDGKVIVTGSFTTFNGNSRTYAIRLNTDGSDDKTFSMSNVHIPAGDPNDIKTILVQADGKILLGGHFFYYTGSNYADDVSHLRQLKGYDNCIRLFTDGTIDQSFTQLVVGSTFTFFPQKDGKIIVTGNAVSPYSYSVGNYNTFRLLSDGSTDKAFIHMASLMLDNNPPANLGTGKAIAVQDDGKIYVGGLFTSYGTFTKYQGIVRVDDSGLEDDGFNPPTNFFKSVNAIALTDDGKVIVGSSSTYDVFTPTLNQGFTILNKDGSIDNTYSLTVPKYGHVSAIIKESASSFLITGQIVKDASNPAKSIVGMVRLKYQ